MLIRRKIDKQETRRKGRQEWPEYCITRQEVLLDPWENDDCAAVIARIFGVSGVSLEGWSTVPGGRPAGISDEQHPVRVLEDPETGFIYYRRPIDIQRAQEWNRNRSMRITAAEW